MYGISWVSVKDVARNAAEAVSSAKAKNATFPVGGPEILTPLEVVKIFEKTGPASWEVSHISVDDLQKQKAAAEDEVQEAVATLQLGYASPGWDLNPSDYLVSTNLKTVEQYAAEVVA